jgi:hypothetical protein
LLARVIGWAVAGLIAIYAAAAFFVAPAMYSDSAWGFLVADSMAHGAAFNHLIVPDPVDITRDRDLFLAVWSPGQYVFAAALERAGLTLGAALTVVTTVFTVLGLVGWYQLYRAWNFPPASAAIAIAITAGTRHLALPFGIYNGGEVLLFGGAPWFLLLLKRWRNLSPTQSIGVLIAFAALAFLKLSALVLAFAALAALVIGDLWPPARIKWRRPLTAAAIGLVFVVAFYVVWYARGRTAADSSGASAWFLVMPRFFEGWGATVSGMVSLGDLAARILRRPVSPILSSLDTLYLLVALPALALLALARRRLTATHADYARFATALALFYVAMMAVLYGRGGPLLMEDRFFRPLSMVLLIGVVHAVASAANRIRLPLVGFAAAMMLYGISSYFVRLDHNAHSPLGRRGFHHMTLSHDGLALMRRTLQGTAGQDGTIVYVMSPELAFEVEGARVIVSAEGEGQLGRRTYKNRATRLFVFVDDKALADRRAEIMLRSFVDYDRDGWTATKSGDATVFAQPSL